MLISILVCSPSPFDMSISTCRSLEENRSHLYFQVQESATSTKLPEVRKLALKVAKGDET